MSAETLRRAAALMRERAEAAAEAWGVESWRHENLGYNDVHGMTYDVEDAEGAHIASAGCEELAHHIASWHPAVALAVADLLDDAAENLDMQAPGGDLRKQWDIRVHIACDKALAVARLYLNEGGES